MFGHDESEMRPWSDSSSDIVPPANPSRSPADGRPRSVSLPLGRQTNYGAIPSLSSVQQNRTAWDRLGLYMKGLPPRNLKNLEEYPRQGERRS